MSYYDKQLKELQEQVRKKKRLETGLVVLKKRKEELAEKVYELEQCKIKEEEDVERLDGHSLSAFFFKLTGQLEQKLSVEQQEAYAAAVKYEVAAAELAGIEERIKSDSEELFRLKNSEQDYEKALKAKNEAVKNANVPEAEEIFTLEKELCRLESQKKEVDEAYLAGQEAEQQFRKVLGHLDSAQSWGTWDVLGGGLIADIAKHGHLDDAQREITRLQMALSKFQRELRDVKLYADIQVSVTGFLRFADYFFDGLFADWAVLSKIEDAKERVYRAQKELNQVMRQLSATRSEMEKEVHKIQSKIQELVWKADIK